MHGTQAKAIVVVAAIVLGLATGASAAPEFATSAYSWPVRPFFAPHPIRGGFDDPRIGARSHNFHFGIDISVPDGTPVYSVASGVVYLRHANAVCIRTNSEQAFAYWHVIPVVDEGEAVAEHQLIGYVGRGWGHVHFAEIENGQVVNPVRPGALGPTGDHVAPTIASVFASVRGADTDLLHLSGAFDLVADVNDVADLRPRGAWRNAVMMPALVQWRLERGGQALSPWTVAVDFRTVRLADDQFNSVYAPGTRQNVPGLPGRYLIYLAHDFDGSRLHGDYRLRVNASDSAGNTAVLVVPLHVR